jgi:prepilin-type N-terminal cleavage/methylation domain-containing protein
MSNTDHDGFTLIEVIASLALAGVVAAVVGLAVATGVRGYVFAQHNADLSQHAMLITQRMFRELTELSAIDVANSNHNCIRYKTGARPYYRAISHYSNRIDLKVDANADSVCPSPGNAGNPLAERVSSFQIQYGAGDGTTGNSPPANLEDLVEVAVSFRLQRLDGETGSDFSFKVNPRNNGMSNGPGL